MQTSRKQNVAIIGAGISGISLGRMINSQSNVTIFVTPAVSINLITN